MNIATLVWTEHAVRLLGPVRAAVESERGRFHDGSVREATELRLLAPVRVLHACFMLCMPFISFSAGASLSWLCLSIGLIYVLFHSFSSVLRIQCLNRIEEKYTW